MNIDLFTNNLAIDYIKNLDYIQEGNIGFTSIIIPIDNNLNYTKSCIESIRKFTTKNSYEMIIIDNNCNEETKKYLKDNKDLIVITNNEDVGIPISYNQGIKVAKGESILVLKNSVIVTPNWLNNLHMLLYSDEKLGAVSPTTNNFVTSQQIDTKINNMEELINFSLNHNTLKKINPQYRLYLDDFCTLFKKHVLNEVQNFDENFSPYFFEDYDISMKIIKQNYYLSLCENSFVYYLAPNPSQIISQDYGSIYWNNYNKLNTKWNFKVEYSSQIRFDLTQFINRPFDECLNVLEVGCGAGSTLLQIKNLYKNANLYGIEICEDSANMAKHFANVINADIEKAKLPYENEFFDYIILGDVLEHLVNPWVALGNLKNHLKPNGSVIASIPNIMHISVINQLLQGNFTYTPFGILDETHLRFFTLSEIEKMFYNNGFSILQIKPNMPSITPVEYDLLNKLCEISGEDKLFKFLSAQYVFEARKF